MAAILALNLGLRFLLEPCLLAAVGYWGFHVGGKSPVRRLGLPILVVVVWGVFIAPKATVKVPTAVWVLLQVALFGGASLGLFSAGQMGLAIVLAVAVALNSLALYLLQRCAALSQSTAWVCAPVLQILRRCAVERAGGQPSPGAFWHRR